MANLNYINEKLKEIEEKIGVKAPQIDGYDDVAESIIEIGEFIINGIIKLQEVDNDN